MAVIKHINKGHLYTSQISYGLWWSFLWSWMVFQLLCLSKNRGKLPIFKHLGYLLLHLARGGIFHNSDDVKRDNQVSPFLHMYLVLLWQMFTGRSYKEYLGHCAHNSFIFTVPILLTPVFTTQMIKVTSNIFVSGALIPASHYGG